MDLTKTWLLGSWLMIYNKIDPVAKKKNTWSLTTTLQLGKTCDASNCFLPTRSRRQSSMQDIS